MALLIANFHLLQDPSLIQDFRTFPLPSLSIWLAVDAHSSHSSQYTCALTIYVPMHLTCHTTYMILVSLETL